MHHGAMHKMAKAQGRARGISNPKSRGDAARGKASTSKLCSTNRLLHRLHLRLLEVQRGGTVANATASSSHAEQKLKEVTSLLKKANPESLTPDLQSFVAEETKAATKKDAKSLYTAVNELTKARESLDTALLARSNLMAQWRAFLTMSLERFRQYSDHFQKQEAAHQENISNAKEMLQKAKTDFNTKEEEATVISDEENEMKDTATKESAVKIMEGLNHMTASLQKLSEQAEMEHNAEEERKAKRPRETKNQEAGEGTLPSMQPFGVPGH